MSNNKELKWAVLGCGVIANELAQAMEKLGRHLYAVGNRTHSKAVEFANKYGVEKVYEDMNDVFEDTEVDIIYITTPHNTHINYLRPALKAGKHVLCEKSITLNSKELMEAILLSKENNVVLAEAMTLYHMPIYKRLKAMADEGCFGQLNVVQMNFGSYKEYDMNNRFFSKNLAGGAMLDIGVYALSFARWFMNEKPSEMLSQVRFAPTGVDEQSSMLLKCDNGVMASIILSLHSKQPKRGLLSYDKAYVEVYEYPRSMKAVITYTDNGHTEEIIEGDTANALMYEVLDMEAAVNSGSSMYLDYSKDVMDLMTEAREQWGMKYPEEQENFSPKPVVVPPKE